MKAICADGTEIECENFKAIDSGVLLTKDRKRKKVIGFVPNGDLRYVVPDDAETEHERDVEAKRSRDESPGSSESESPELSAGERRPSERERSGERGQVELAALRERLDRLEVRVALSTSEDESESKSRPSAAEGIDGNPPERVAEGTRVEPTPETETELVPDAEDAGGNEREGSGNRTTPTGADGATDRETERVGTSGFDPVAIVAEQREREEASESADRSGSDEEIDTGADADTDTDADRHVDTETGTIDVGRSDPVATVARQAVESSAEGERSEENDESEDGEGENGHPSGRVDSASSVESDGDSDGREEIQEPKAALQRVDGLGPTYADRLTEGGIETLADLEGATPEEVASIAEVSESRAEEWIEQAGELPS